MFSSISYLEPSMDNKAKVISSSLLSYRAAEAQESPHISNFDSTLNDNSTIIQQNDTSIVKASGHFANNQIQDNVVTWIQGGMWNLDIKGSENKSVNSPNMTAAFDANFTMIKPDGSLSHNHIIDNFKSENVIFAGNDIIIIGISDIHSDNGIEFSQVPITVHLMGKKVLGLMIDVNKTSGHFSGDNEMFGTLISGLGLESSDMDNNSNSNNLTNSGIPLDTNSTSQAGSLNHTMH
jgi:hypothetical protein